MVLNNFIVIFDNRYACFGFRHISSLYIMIKRSIVIIFNFFPFIYLCFKWQLNTLNFLQHIRVIICLQILMGHIKIYMVSFLISNSVLYSIYMLQNLLFFLHGPCQIRFAENFNFSASEFDFVFAFFYVKYFLKDILKYFKINFIGLSEGFLPENFY